MQQQCSDSGRRRNCSPDAQAGSAVPCSCGLFQGVDDAGSGPFSIFLATAAINEQQLPEDGDPSCLSPSSAVDCTLSLGTPSTRHQSSTISKPYPFPAVIHRQQQNTNPLRFGFLRTDQPKGPKQTSPSPAAGGGRATALRTGGAGLILGGGPALLPRRCASCDTTSTPLWRNGPRGPKSLCNACGIRYKKEERRAVSSAAAQLSTSSSSSSCSASSPAVHPEALPSQQQQQQQHLTTAYSGQHHHWGYPATRLQAAARKCPSSTILSAISLGDNVDAMETTALPYVSWQRFDVSVPSQAAEFATSRFQDYSLH